MSFEMNFVIGKDRWTVFISPNRFTWMIMKWESRVLNAGEAFLVLKKISNYTVETITDFQYEKERQFDLNRQWYKRTLTDTAKEYLYL